MLPPDNPVLQALAPETRAGWCPAGTLVPPPHPAALGLGLPMLVFGPAWLCHPTSEHCRGPWDSSTVMIRRVISKAIGKT